MNWKLFFVVLVALSSWQIAYTQYTPNHTYDHESIYLKTTPFVGMRYVKNGVMKPVGILSYRLQDELEVSPNAVMELKKYRRKSLAASGLGLLSGLVILSAFNVSDNEEVLLLGGLGLGIVSGALSVSSSNSLQKSIWWYNRDILKE